MNNQEALDMGYAFLRMSVVASATDDPDRLTGLSLLFNKDMKCFVGALIPDDEYSDFLETRTLDEVMGSIESLHDCTLGFLIQAQNIHDDKLVEDWEASYRALAKDWKLEWNFGDSSVG